MLLEFYLLYSKFNNVVLCHFGEDQLFVVQFCIVYSRGGQPYDSMRQFFSRLIEMRHTNIHFFSVLSNVW